MKSQYKRDLSKQYFRPLKGYDYSPKLANNEQIGLAEMLSKKYGIPEGNILRLIMYTEIAWRYATESEIQFYYSDMKEIAEFEKNPVPIGKIIFVGFYKPLGYIKSFEIESPFLIDRLYYSMIDFIDPRNFIKDKITATKKKRPSLNIIRLIATEIYNELISYSNIDNWHGVVVTGYIFGFYNIGIKKTTFVMNEQQHKQVKDKKDDEAYKKYVIDRKKSFRIMGVLAGDIDSREEWDLKNKSGNPLEYYPTYLHGRVRRYINY